MAQTLVARLDGTAAAITEERIVFVRGDGTPAADHPFEGRHPAAWWLRGGFAAVSTVTGLEGGSAVLSTLGSDGRILGSCTADRDVTALAGAGGGVLETGVPPERVTRPTPGGEAGGTAPGPR